MPWVRSLKGLRSLLGSCGTAALLTSATACSSGAGASAGYVCNLAGGCDPTILYTTQETLVDLAISPDDVFVLGTRSLQRIPKAGGPPVVLVSEGGSRVVTDAMSVYWIDAAGTSVNRVSVEGGPVVGLAQCPTGCADLAVDETNVYWIEAPPPSSGTGAIYRAPKNGGPELPQPTLLATPFAAFGVDSRGFGVAGSSVYFVDLDVTASAQLVKRVGIEEGPPQALADLPPPAVLAGGNEVHVIDGLLATPGGAYVTVSDAVVALPDDGGQSLVVAQVPGSSTSSVLVDDRHLTFAFTNGDIEALGQVPLGGGSVTVLRSGGATGTQPYQAVKMDQTTFYYLTNGGESSGLMRLDR